MSLTIGSPAPAFSLPATDGREIGLAALEGRKIVLYFYPKDDTSGCTLEAQAFQSLKKDFAAADTEIVGVSPDSLKSHDKFRAKYRLDFALASDEETRMLQSLWRLGGEEHVRPEIHGRGAHHGPDRPRRHHRPGLEQGEGRGPRGGGAGCGEGSALIAE